MTAEQIQHWFTYHAPKDGDIDKFAAVRCAGMALALTIIDHTPAGADQTSALRKVREAVMTANAAIACEGT